MDEGFELRAVRNVDVTCQPVEMPQDRRRVEIVFKCGVRLPHDVQRHRPGRRPRPYGNAIAPAVKRRIGLVEDAGIKLGPVIVTPGEQCQSKGERIPVAGQPIRQGRCLTNLDAYPAEAFNASASASDVDIDRPAQRSSNLTLAPRHGRWMDAKCAGRLRQVVHPAWPTVGNGKGHEDLYVVQLDHSGEDIGNEKCTEVGETTLATGMWVDAHSQQPATAQSDLDEFTGAGIHKTYHVGERTTPLGYLAVNGSSKARDHEILAAVEPAGTVWVEPPTNGPSLCQAHAIPQVVIPRTWRWARTRCHGRSD